MIPVSTVRRAAIRDMILAVLTREGSEERDDPGTRKTNTGMQDKALKHELHENISLLREVCRNPKNHGC